MAEHHASAPPGAPGRPPYDPPAASIMQSDHPRHAPSGTPAPVHAHSQIPQTGPQRPARGRISIRQGPGQGSVAELSDVTVVGNQPGQATLLLADPRIGPRHVEILRHAYGFYARDLGSQRGTSCRGQQLGPQPFKLHHGDVIVLGQNVVALLFEAAQ